MKQTILHGSIIAFIFVFSIILSILWTTVINVPTIKPIQPTDVMEVDEIGLYSDGEILVIYDFKENRTLYEVSTLISTKYYLIDNNTEDIKSSITKSYPLDTFTNYFDFSESKWGTSLTVREYELTLNQGKFVELVKE